MMENNKKTPKIRFPGFTDDWEQRKFGELLNETRDKTTVEDEDTLLSCAIEGMFLNSELFSHFRGSSNIGYLKVKKNDLILSAQNLHLGNCNVNLRFEHGIISPAYKVYELINCDPLFIQAWVKQDKTKDFFLKASTEGASVCRKNIVWEELYKQELPVPKIDEQVKIGEFFADLNNLITLHQRKCDLIRDIKKGLLQKMFPKDGQKIPELRFPGFTGDWEQRKLLDCLTQPISDGPHETPDLVDEGIPFISVDAIVDNKIDFERKRGYITEEYDLECRKKYSPQRDDVYLVKSGSTVGKVAIVETDERFNIWSPLAAMRANKEVLLPKYLYYYLQLDDIQDEVSAKSKGGTQPNLSMRILEKFIVRLPDVEEQEKISDSLSDIDNLITLHQRKLEKYKELKKGLLQQMFV